MDIKLPNIRKHFIPDPGYIICDVDLSGADAQVVAWEAEDEELKKAFRNGLNVHNYNGECMWGTAYEPNVKRPGALYTMREEMKRGVHATNYAVSSRNLAGTLQWKMQEADTFKSRWFTIHPGILAWQRRTDYTLNTTRTISNAFGYRIKYFDRADNLLPTALAWIPQSTVGIVCSKGAVNTWKNLPFIHPLLQVHDSFVFQLPFAKFEPSVLEAIKRHLSVEVPYPDPLVIPWELAASDKSWGDCTKRKWTGELK